MAQICHEFDNRELPLQQGIVAHMSAALTAALPDPYPYFSKIFVLSRSTKIDFCRAFPHAANQVSVMGHGPELLFAADSASVASVASYYRIAEDHKIVLMYGALRPSKGAADLIEAFASLVNSAQGIDQPRLIIAGYPSREFDSSALVRRINELQIADRVMLDLRYLAMEELGALVSRADVVVFPYRSATASGALALAQSLGRPAVATTVGGLGDDIEDGVTGWLVAPQDPDAMAEKIATVLGDAQAAQKISAQGQQTRLVENAWRKVAQRFLDECAKDDDCHIAR